MAFNCATNPGGEWRSKLISDSGAPEIDDGLIEVDSEDAATGDFLGTHLYTGGLIRGKCRAGSGDTCTNAAPCHIEFDRRVKESNQFFHYHYAADFKLNDAGNSFVTINGRYTKRVLPMRDRRRVTGDDDGTWVGTKPPT